MGRFNDMLEEHKQGSVFGLNLEAAVLVVYPLIIVPFLGFLFREWRRNKANDFTDTGYMKLGLKRLNISNLVDESDSRYAIEKTEDQAPWTVKALFIHPIKSCRAVEVESAALDGAGMLWDRKFAFAELQSVPTKEGSSDAAPEKRWNFRTLRQPGYEKMAMIRPEIWLSLEKNSPEQQTAESDGYMIVKFPYVPSGLLAPLDRLLLWLDLIDYQSAFRVPLVPRKNHRYPIEEVTIWKDTPKWLNLGEHIPPAFQTWLGAKNPVTLFRVDPESHRQLFRNAPRKKEIGYQPRVGFADAYPLHLLNLASVRDVAKKVEQSIPEFTARRFRPNLVVTGGAKYNEDDWKRIKVGEHTLHCACHTIRCRLPNVDPDTANRHPVEPDKTLKSFRCIDDGDPLNAALGLQLVPAKDQVFEIKVGDQVKVLERGEHHYMKQ